VDALDVGACESQVLFDGWLAFVRPGDVGRFGDTRKK
jgi:hypothetical protein